ncbi:MAG: DUF2723 domain-containing protein, partial [Chitinophagaceae bacterium]
LKWEEKADSSEADKWLILIAYMMGLSIGVHLLNLLAIPALAFIYYFRKNPATLKGMIITFGISAVIIVFIQSFIIPGLPSIAGGVEIFFVNSMGMPFGTGIIIFLLLFLGLVIYGILYSIRKNMRFLNTALLCFVFILIGYSTYMIIPIRSGYNPTIDENDPENIISFVSYLKREQYGDRPLLKGPVYTSELVAQEEGAAKYRKAEDKYEVFDHAIIQKYDTEVLFPRLYSNTPQHIEEYKKWVNVPTGAKPTLGDNLAFFFNFQINQMYWRYFLWNFVGRESDIQHAGVIWPWESGENLPERIADSKARNNFYMLPFILGILGVIYQFKRRKEDTLVVGLLFFLTGFALVIYLNSPPIEPRERDYAYVGSFYTFAVWIGLGVLAIADMLSKILKNNMARATAATAVCLSVPIIMAAEGWDDHDRSNRYHSVDSAINLLESCAPNAILFTNGDNDTFPLWYAQEVEGVRTDVRVAVLSYLNTDWYIDQMKRQAYKSMPLPISMENKTYRQGTNDYLPYVENAKLKNSAIDLKQFMNLVNQNHQAIQVNYSGNRTILSYPTKKFYLNVDPAQVAAANAVPENRRSEIVNRIDFTINKSMIEKKHLLIMDLLANNNWERPIYFSTTVNSADFMGLQDYFQLEGLAYRIVPVKSPNPAVGTVATDIMYNNMMTKFKWREMDNPNVFYDENYLRFPANARDKYYRLAKDLYEKGDLERSKKVVDHVFTVMPDESIPFDYYVPQFVELMIKMGNEKKANEIINTLTNRSDKALTYYLAQPVLSDVEVQTNLYTLNQLMNVTRVMGMADKSKEIETIFMKHYSKVQ